MNLIFLSGCFESTVSLNDNAIIIFVRLTIFIFNLRINRGNKPYCKIILYQPQFSLDFLSVPTQKKICIENRNERITVSHVTKPRYRSQRFEHKFPP